jgi:hypothetical protein|tara:strand:+ start:607 stop:1344 length:738 start_codon:yes stop_codon:yes gene_type:complete
MPQTLKEELNRVKEIMFPKTTIEEGKHESSYMAKSQLYNIAKKAQSVHDRLEDNEQIDDWMESKIAQMADNIDSVINAFDYDEFEEKTVCDHCGKSHEGDCEMISLEEDIMYGMQGGYPDTSDTEPGYDFDSKGPLGSEPELEDEGFTEPETNYSKIQKGFNFDSDGPEDSYMDASDEYNMELGYELGEQDAGTGTGESDDGAGAGTASVGVWDSGVARGIANQLANTKWSDTYQPSRGKANPLW